MDKDNRQRAIGTGPSHRPYRTEASHTCSINITSYNTCGLDDRVALVVIMASEPRWNGRELQDPQEESCGKGVARQGLAGGSAWIHVEVMLP